MGMRIKSSLAVEHFAGDNLKVIGEMCHQLSESDKLQNAEILALIEAELENNPLPRRSSKLRRPQPAGQFLNNYHSGNELTRSVVKKEKGIPERIEVIYRMCAELASYDGLKKHQILALVKVYLDEHILEVDI